jgi:broad specificity phosphatase PhoE
MNRRLIIIRHGEGEHLTQGFFSSRIEHPNYRPAHLTEEGRAQALRAGRALAEMGIVDEDIEVVLVSPLPRTIETADGLFQGGGIRSEKQVIEPLLIEISLGDMEGSSTIEWIQSGRGFTDFSDAHTYKGETNADVAARMQALIQRIRETWTRGHIIAITHSLPAYELSGILTGKKVELGVAEPLVLEMEGPLSPSRDY